MTAQAQSDKIQVWRNGVMIGLRTKEQVENMRRDLEKMGWTVKDAGHYVTFDKERGGKA